MVYRGRRVLAPVAAMVLVLLLAPLVAIPSALALQGDAEKLRVTATVGMIGDLVQNIGGDRVEVVSLMGPGVDPHLYKPSAGDVGRLEEADIIFYGGLELEGRMTDTFVRVARTGKPTIPVAEGIPEDLLREPAEFQGKYDPHIWFDVTLWMLAAQTVNTQLAALEPSSAAAFQANTDAYLGELEGLHAYVQEQTARIPEGQRVLITAHDAFGYFGDRYGLEVRGLQGISTAAEVSANDIQALADFIAERRIPAVFVESSVPPATIEALQGAVRSRGFEVAIGGQLFSDAMGETGTPEGTYLGMVRHNVDTIVGALAVGAPVSATPETVGG
ncbi:MAG TPA: zinc ABC transporter substrate-binding protein [Thermomicrobiales bacterium]|nr:zinc ABC transporter substrate-binding protein [Thermomicrobiales bacterium]